MPRDRVHEVEKGYYADGEDAYAMRRYLRTLTPAERDAVMKDRRKDRD